MQYYHDFDITLEGPTVHPGTPHDFAVRQMAALGDSFINDVKVARNIRRTELPDYPLKEEHRVRAPASRPDFHKLQRAGVIVMNPYHVGRKTITHAPGVIRGIPFRDMRGWYRYKSDKDRPIWGKHLIPNDENYFVILESAITPVSSVHPRHLNCPLSRALSPLPPKEGAVIAEAYAKANEGSLDLLTTLAELREVIDLFGSLARRLISMRRTIKSIPLRPIRKATDQWLEYRYGIMPIVYTLNDALEAIRSMDRVYGRFTSRFGDETAASDRDIGKWRVSSASKVEHRVLVKRRYDPQTLLNAFNHLSINPLLTMWELLPYSFVVDWFVNVGDFISAVASPSLHCDEGATYSIRLTRTETASHVSGITSVSQEDQYVRYLITNWDSRIEFQPSLTWKRMVDAFALLWPSLSQALRRSL